LNAKYSSEGVDVYFINNIEVGINLKVYLEGFFMAESSPPEIDR